MNKGQNEVRKVLKKKSIKGQSMAEYALIIALVALALIGGLTYLSTAMNTTLETSGDILEGTANKAREDAESSGLDLD